MSEGIRLAVLLTPIGLAIGFMGSLAGVGGGFLIVPFLLLAGPVLIGKEFSPELASGTSLAIVFLNSLSGSSVAAARRRIDYRLGLMMTLVALPGVYLGRVAVRLIPPGPYSLLFVALLILIAVNVVFGRQRKGRPLLKGTRREIRDGDGELFQYEVNYPTLLIVSVLTGFLASMFGVGGGIIYVPLLVMVFGMPMHIATATSQFVILLNSVVGGGESAWRGKIAWEVVLWTGLGVLMGAQIGTRLAKRVPERAIRILLGVILLIGAVGLTIRTI